MNKNGIVTL